MTDRPHDLPPRVADELREAAQTIGNAIARQQGIARLRDEIAHTARTADEAEKAGETALAQAYGLTIDRGMRMLAAAVHADPAVAELCEPDQVLAVVVRLFAATVPELSGHLPDPLPPISFRKYPSLSADAIRFGADGSVLLNIGAVANKGQRDRAVVLAQYQVDARRGRARGGRPRGIKPLSAEENSAAQGYNTEMGDRQVYDLLIESGQYERDGDFADPNDYKRNKRRVERFRRKVEGFLGEQRSP